MLVEAIFWFHPLVWWIGSRLVEERERACDEEVIRLGNQPHVYAESILKTCQFFVESPLTCMSGVTGADLKKRIVHIMGGTFAARLTLRKKNASGRGRHRGTCIAVGLGSDKCFASWRPSSSYV
jgi:beta-lactamase regulating signal transducer with metallopeptidase domain